jgi:hypothetical protein
MQSLCRHISSIHTSEFKSMNSLASLCSDLSDSGLPCGTESQAMPLITAYELLSHLPDQSRFTLFREAYTADASVAEEKMVSLTGLMVRDASGSISFYEEIDADQGDDVYFSIEVPVESASTDCTLVIDPERAASFRITVFGMLFPVNGGLQIVTLMLCRNLRYRQGYMGTGKQICIFNQQLIL